KSDFYGTKYLGAQDVYYIEKDEGRFRAGLTRCWRVWCDDGNQLRYISGFMDHRHALKRQRELRIRWVLYWIKPEVLNRIIRSELRKSRRNWCRVCDEWSRYRGDPDYDKERSGSTSDERGAAGGNNVINFPRMLPRNERAR